MSICVVPSVEGTKLKMGWIKKKIIAGEINLTNTEVPHIVYSVYYVFIVS